MVEEEEDLDSSNANFALEGESSPKEGITPIDDSKKSILGVLGGLDEEPKEDENINKGRRVKKLPRFMFKQNGLIKKNWNLFIIVLAIYNSISIPLQLSFSPKILQEANFRFLDSFIDLLFLFDVIFTFRTTYLDQEG